MKLIGDLLAGQVGEDDEPLGFQQQPFEYVVACRYIQRLPDRLAQVIGGNRQQVGILLNAMHLFVMLFHQLLKPSCYVVGWPGSSRFRSASQEKPAFPQKNMEVSCQHAVFLFTALQVIRQHVFQQVPEVSMGSLRQVQYRGRPFVVPPVGLERIHVLALSVESGIVLRESDDVPYAFLGRRQQVYLARRYEMNARGMYRVGMKIYFMEPATGFKKKDFAIRMPVREVSGKRRYGELHDRQAPRHLGCVLKPENLKIRQVCYQPGQEMNRYILHI